MKNVISSVLCVMLVFLATHANAQIQNKLPISEPDYQKPKLFNNLPSVLPLNVGQVNAALNKTEGAE